MASTEKLSALVQSQFPDFYKEEGEKFLAFMEAYYEYLEQNGKLTDSIRNLQSYRDIETTTDEYLEYFQKDLLPSVPTDVLADKKLLAKYIKFFNQARGTLSSYKLLFRALYNEQVEVNYPADQMLKVSDGDWRIDRYLITDFDESTYKFIGKTIKGSESDAEALIEDVVRRVVRGRDIMQLLVSNVKGKFNNKEPIRLKTDTNSTGHSVIIEAGISNVSVVSPGAYYAAGDVVDLISDDVGRFAKVVVTKTIDLGGTLTFAVTEGGSGYTASTNTPQGSLINIVGGDGVEDGSFVIGQNDVDDTFALSLNTNLITSNNTFGALAPSITNADGVARKMSTFANVVLSSPSFGFPEASEVVTSGKDYRTNANAIIQIANTSQGLVVGQPIYGATSGANGVVKEVVSATAGNAWFRVDTYKKFSATENVKVGSTTGNTVGTVTSFQSNTIGHHVLQLGNVASQSISEGDELVGRTSNAFGIVKKVVSDQANGYTRQAGGADDRNLVTVIVSSNNTSNLTSQFDNGPMRAFVENEGLRVVGANTTVGNVASTTSNTEYENIYTKLSDSLVFKSTTIGTISKLSSVVGGSGYSVKPTVSVTEPAVASLGIGEQYITIQNTSPNWGTSNSQITQLDSNDRVVQSSSGASGDVKQRKSQVTHANGVVETVVRVWQDSLQRDPGNIQYANNTTVSIKFYADAEQTTLTATGTGKIVLIDDKGVLGKNANINATVGANGTIDKVKVLDSGFGYKSNETVRVKETSRSGATQAQVKITLGDVANSEGYYASSRSHVSSKRGYIHDNKYYQEYAYEVIAPIALARYRDIALNLVHPAGQALFGKYQTHSNVSVDVTTTANNSTRLKANGTVSLTNGSFTVTGTGTKFESQYSNNGVFIVEYEHKKYYRIPINIVSSNTSANLTIAWANTNLSGANAYYNSGSIS